MDHRDYISGLLRRTGLYTLNGQTAVDRELDAYMAGLEILYDAAEEAIREAFLQTAEESGLQKAEAVYGMNGEGLTAEERRRRLLLRCSVRNGDKKSLYRLMGAFGISDTIAENFSGQSLCVMPQPNLSQEQEGWLEKVFPLFLPAHLAVSIDFRSLLWSSVDKAGRTWAQMEAAQMSWKAIDAYNGSVEG